MFKDLSGKKFGRLKVISLAFIDKDKNYKCFWNCLCDCGNKIIRRGNFYGKHEFSCGCFNKDFGKELNRVYCLKHGLSKTKIYKLYKGLVSRCNNKNNPAYRLYGNRGIKCLWRSFEHFYRDMGEAPKGLTLDRINNNGNYCKENCRWATKKEQAINRRSTDWITFKGKTLNQRQWAKELNISYKTLNHRINHSGWPLSKILTAPLRKMVNNTIFVER